MAKISWTESEKKVYDLIIEHKKEFYREARNLWVFPWFSTYYSGGAGTTGYQGLLRREYLTSNPNMGHKLLCLGKTIHTVLKISEPSLGMSGPETVGFLKKLLSRFGDRIERKLTIKSPTGDPFMPTKRKKLYHTTLLTELLGRGFICHDDKGSLILEPGWHILCSGMVLNKPAMSKKEGLDMYERFAPLNLCQLRKY